MGYSGHITVNKSIPICKMISYPTESHQGAHPSFLLSHHAGNSHAAACPHCTLCWQILLWTISSLLSQTGCSAKQSKG